MKLVWDQADCSLELGGLTVVAPPRDYPPFACQAMVEEQDTHLTLGEQTVLTDPGKPTWYLAHTVERDEGYALGSVISKGEKPLRLLAVVHDLDQEPTCTPAAVKQAYQAIMDIVAQRKLTSLALPLLGTVHGKVAASHSLQLLCEAIHQGFPKQLQQLWLMLAEGSPCHSKTLLSQLAHLKAI